MIKNEAVSIVKTLLPLVQAGIKNIVILDTGSTDNTLQITQDFFSQHAITKYIYQEPFIDFSTSRNRALTLAALSYPATTFYLMLDAEWTLHHADALINFCEAEKYKSTPLYLIKIYLASFEFTVARLFRASANIKFRGIVHEVPEIPTHVQVSHPVYIEVTASAHGIAKTEQRWQRDVKLLLKSYTECPEDPRTVFYLAQTYQCLGELEKAYAFYQIREKQQGWAEEDFITLYRLGCLEVLLINLKHKNFLWSQALDYFLKAHALRPSRIEPLVMIADHYWPDNIPTCYLFIRRAYDLPYPKNDILFIDKEMYNYTRYEIMSRCAWYVGEYALGLNATLQALKIHPTMEHLQNNLNCYQEKVGQEA